MQGEFEITVVSDGYISIPEEILVTDGTADQRAALLPRLDRSGGMVRPKANIPVLRKGSEVILIDIGSGRKYQPTDGRLDDNLRLANIDAASVTRIVFSHAHPDHIWATLKEMGCCVSRTPPTMSAEPSGTSGWTPTTSPPCRSSCTSSRGGRSGIFRPFGTVSSWSGPATTSCRAFARWTPPATAGHLSFEVTGGEGLLIAVDVANNEVVSFEHPDWPFGYDTLPDIAIKTRRALLDRAAADRTKLLGYHWAYPGVGYAVRRADAFAFTPATR